MYRTVFDEDPRDPVQVGGMEAAGVEEGEMWGRGGKVAPSHLPVPVNCLDAACSHVLVPWGFQNKVIFLQGPSAGQIQGTCCVTTQFIAVFLPQE